MKIEFTKLPTTDGTIKVSLDGGQSFTDYSVADIQESGISLSDDQNYEKIQIRGPANILKNLDIVSSVKIEGASAEAIIDGIVFTYQKNLGTITVTEPKNGYVLETIDDLSTGDYPWEIWVLDEDNAYYVGKSFGEVNYDYYENGLKKCFESIAGKDNLKIGLLLGGNWSGPKTYLGDNCKEIVKNKVIAIFNEVTTFEDYCKLFETDKTAIVALDNLEEFLKNGDYKNYDNIKVTGIINQEMFNRFASIKLQTDGQYVRPDYRPTVIKNVERITVDDCYQSGLVIPSDCTELDVSISWVGDCNLHFFGLREDYDRILVDLKTDSSGGNGIVYDKYNNVLEDWVYN